MKGFICWHTSVESFQGTLFRAKEVHIEQDKEKELEFAGDHKYQDNEITISFAIEHKGQMSGVLNSLVVSIQELNPYGKAYDSLTFLRF